MDKMQELDVAQIIHTTPRLTRIVVRWFRRPLNRLICRIIMRAYERSHINSHQMHLLLAQLDPTKAGRLRPDVKQVLKDAAEIRSACGFMWMRMAVAKDAQDAYDVAKQEFQEHGAAFKRLETSLPAALAEGAVSAAPPAQKEK